LCEEYGASHQPSASRIRDLAALLFGFVSIWAIPVLILVVQGAGHAAFAALSRYGGALATFAHHGRPTPPPTSTLNGSRAARFSVA